MAHLALKCLPIRQFVFLKPSTKAWTATSNTDQVSLIDGLANVEHFDHFAPLIGWRQLLLHLKGSDLLLFIAMASRLL